MGIRWLCGYVEPDGTPIDGCKLLVSLFVRYTNVTVNGVRLAMAQLQDLMYLDFEGPLPVVLNAVRAVHPPRFLVGFSCYREGTVHFKTLLYLSRDVEMLYDILEPRSLNRHLVDTEDTMQTFDVQPGIAGEVETISFMEGIVPFLARFGQNLKLLTLVSFDNVDAFLLFRLCPRLNTLLLHYSASYISSFPHPPISQKLECFIYLGQNSDCIESVELQWILNSPLLKHVEICNCPNLTDSIFSNSFAHHEFANLERLILRKCDNVSSEIFASVFLSRTNHLKAVVLDRCAALCTLTNQTAWSALKRVNNWDLDFRMTSAESERTINL